MVMHEWLRPHQVIDCVAELDCAALAARGIRGVILDLDNTLTAWRCLEVTDDVHAWVGRLQALGLQACVVSNAATLRRVQPVADCLRLPCVTRAFKPLPHGFRQGMLVMGTTPDTTAIIGDQLFTDILGGNRLGLYTILVEPISSRESLFTRLVQRPLERAMGRVPKRVGEFEVQSSKDGTPKPGSGIGSTPI